MLNRFFFSFFVMVLSLASIFFCLCTSSQAADISSGLTGGVACFTTPAGETAAIALAKSPANWIVIVLAPDLAQVESLRRKFITLDLPVGKLYANTGSATAMPFIDNFVDLVVTDEVTPEVMRVLTPVRGRAVAGDKITNKPAIEGGDAWSHYAHGADQNRSSSDSSLKWPYSLQWTAKPWYDGMFDIAVAAGGRLFRVSATLDIGQRTIDGLTVRSAYNGQILWKRPVSENFGTYGSLLVATAESVYLKDGARVLLLDPETGNEIRCLVASEDTSLECKWIVLQDGILLVVLGQAPTGESLRKTPHDIEGLTPGNLSESFTKQQIWFQKYDEGTSLVALDATTGKQLWKFSADIVDPAKLAICGERVFVYANREYATCLDLKTGKPLWKTEAPIVKEPFGTGWSLTYMATERVSGIASPDIYLINSYKDGHCQAFSATDGKILWTRASGRGDYEQDNRQPILGYPVITDKTILDRYGKFYDIFTGEKNQENWAMGYPGCGSWCLTTNGVHGMAGSIYDRLTQSVLPSGFMKTACPSGVIVADGILQSGHGACVNCMEWLGHLAFASQPAKSVAPATPAERLESAPTASVASTLPAAPSDWPTYRADNSRSNSSIVAAPATAQVLWHYEATPATVASAPLSQPPPIAIGDKIYFPQSAGNLLCIEAATGKEVWSYPTGGRFLSPPSYWNGRIYIGAGDGFLYCLDAATGHLAWRYRIAPQDQHTLVFGYLSSPWPVNANVLVQPEPDGKKDGKKATVYASAGLIGLIGGAFLCALDATTGQPRWEINLDKEFPALTPPAIGQLAWNSGKLWMQCGASGPFVADPATGKITPAIDFDSLDYRGGSRKQDIMRNYTYVRSKGQDIGILPGGWVILGGHQFYFPEYDFLQPRNSILFFKATASGIPNSSTGYPDCIALENTGISSTMPTWDDKTIFLSISGGPAFIFDSEVLDKTLAQNPFDASINHRAFWNQGIVNSIEISADAQTSILPEKWQRRPMRNPLLCSNALLFLLEIHGEGWSIVATTRNAEAPETLWQVYLPSRPANGGFIIDSKGRMLIPLCDGSLVCIGE